MGNVLEDYVSDDFAHENLIFTIIDSFTDYNNVVMKYINEQQIGMRLAYSSTLGWIYFLMVAVIIVMVYLIINKRVFYQV